MANSKPWYSSKTIIMNIIALVLLIITTAYGIEFPPEVAIGILAVINLILRAVTKKPLWE